MQNLDQLNSEAPIIKKITDLYEEFYLYLKVFPKKDQYMLGKRCEEYLLIFIELVLSAVGLEKSRKLATLEEANGKFDVLKVLFRTAHKLKIIDTKKYLSLEEKANLIGRMLGGWIRSLR